MPLGDIIRRNRLRQNKIAEAVGVTEETVSRWAQGHVEPGGINLVRLLAYLRQFEGGLEAADLVIRDPLSAPAPAGEGDAA